jgi:hypothetical protein
MAHDSELDNQLLQLLLDDGTPPHQTNQEHSASILLQLSHSDLKSSVRFSEIEACMEEEEQGGDGVEIEFDSSFESDPEEMKIDNPQLHFL